MPFQLIFLKFCPQNLLQFENVPIKCSKHYVEFICRRACDKNSSLNFMLFMLVSRSPKSGYSFGKFTAEQVLKSFSGKNSSLKPPVLEFCDSLPFGLEESRE